MTEINNRIEKVAGIIYPKYDGNCKCIQCGRAEMKAIEICQLFPQPLERKDELTPVMTQIYYMTPLERKIAGVLVDCFGCKGVTRHIEMVARRIGHLLPQPLEDEKLREALAKLEHDQWRVWASSLMERELLSPERMERWQKLLIPYAELTEEQKDQDRKWADKALALLQLKIEEARGQGKKKAVGFIESYLVTTVHPEGDMHHIDDKEWQSVKLKLLR